MAERRAIRATGLRLATTARTTAAAPIRRLPIIRTVPVPTAETAAIQRPARTAALRVPTPRHARLAVDTAAAVADSMAAVVEDPTVVVAMVAAEATVVAAIARVCI